MSIQFDTKEEALRAYQKIHPNFTFPENFPDSRIIEIIQQSEGRRIIFVNQDNTYQIYFEDEKNAETKLAKWDKLIGCGG